MKDNILAQVQELKEYGKLSETGWELEPIDLDDWRNHMDSLMSADAKYKSAWQWWIGDGFNRMPHGDMKAECERLDFPYETAKHLRKIANAYEKGVRTPFLTFTHHAVIAYLDPVERERLKKIAIEKNLSTRQLAALRDENRHERLPPQPPIWIAESQFEIPTRPPDSQPNYNQSGRARQEVTQGNDPIVAIPDGETPDNTKEEGQQEWLREEIELWQKAKSGITVVADMHNGVHPNLIAAAKSEERFVRIDRKSLWGNRYRENIDGDRNKVCDLYEWFFWMIDNYMANIDQLKGGMVLGCWCHPQRCHGHFLADVANGKITRDQWTCDRLPELLRMYFPKDEKVGGAGDDTPN